MNIDLKLTQNCFVADQRTRDISISIALKYTN